MDRRSVRAVALDPERQPLGEVLDNELEHRPPTRNESRAVSTLPIARHRDQALQRTMQTPVRVWTDIPRTPRSKASLVRSARG